MEGRGEGGNREVSPQLLLSARGDRSGAGAEAYPEEGVEPKASDHATFSGARLTTSRSTTTITRKKAIPSKAAMMLVAQSCVGSSP